MSADLRTKEITGYIPIVYIRQGVIKQGQVKTIAGRFGIVIDNNDDWCQISGIVIVGNLTINGSLVEKSGGVYSQFDLYVTGDLKVENIVSEGILVVGGDFRVTNMIIGYHNDNMMLVKGQIHAKIVYSDDHIIDAYAGFNVEKEMDNNNEAKDFLIKSVLDKEGYIDYCKLIDQTLANKNVIKKKIVSKEEKELLKIEKALTKKKKVIDLYGYSITYIPDFVYENGEVEELNLRNSEVEEITSDIVKLGKLRDLRIGELTKIPAEITKLENL